MSFTACAGVGVDVGVGVGVEVASVAGGLTDVGAAVSESIRLSSAELACRNLLESANVAFAVSLRYSRTDSGPVARINYQLKRIDLNFV